MRRILISVLTVMVIFVMAANFAPAKTSTSTLKVNGMVCGDCTGKVTEALEKIDGVKKVDVDLESSEAKVTYNSRKVKESNLEQAVVLAGFTVGSDKVSVENSKKCSGKCAGIQKSSAEESCKSDAESCCPASEGVDI